MTKTMQVESTIRCSIQNYLPQSLAMLYLTSRRDYLMLHDLSTLRVLSIIYGCESKFNSQT